MAKKKKDKKAQPETPSELSPGSYEPQVPGGLLEAFIGVWREIDENGDMATVVRLVGPNEEGLPDKIIALGMLAEATKEVHRYYQDIHMSEDGDWDEEY